MINWKISEDDRILIQAIAERAYVGLGLDHTRTMMDLTASHANGNPLKLEGLLNANIGDFGHDVGGIARFINRSTGELTDCFVPRYSHGKL